MQPPSHDPDHVLDALYNWCRARSFTGYNKHDGLNSPLLRLLLGWSKWPRIAAIQMVMRSPVNIRPLLLVRKAINPKGIALFLLGLADRYHATGNPEFIEQAKALAPLLDKCVSPGRWSGPCWGYHYPWQDLGFFAPAGTPNAVVSSFVCEALLALYRLTKDDGLLRRVKGCCDFFLHDLTVLQDDPRHLCLAYMPLPMRMRVMDVSILVAAVLAQYAAHAGDNSTRAAAARLTRYVVDRQTEYGAWFYTDPPTDSHIRHDNYHTGFILDALWRYMEAGDDWNFLGKYEKGIEFYAESLFNQDGSPRWMSDRDYPHDIHGAAQGLITFSQAARHGYPYAPLSRKIYQWALRRMYSPEGRFFYQEYPHFRKKFTLMRWCNAWMFRGIASFGRHLGRHHREPPP